MAACGIARPGRIERCAPGWPAPEKRVFPRGFADAQARDAFSWYHIAAGFSLRQIKLKVAFG
jgi:hypothetical protein